MRISEFFAHVKAEMAGGKIKAFYEGVHYILAEILDGNPQLTADGQKLKADIEAAAPVVDEAVKQAADTAIAGAITDPAIAAVAEAAANIAADKVGDLIYPTSDDTSAAQAQPVPTDANGNDLTKAPARVKKPKA